MSCPVNPIQHHIQKLAKGNYPFEGSVELISLPRTAGIATYSRSASSLDMWILQGTLSVEQDTVHWRYVS